MARYHYPMTLPLEFNPWIGVDNDRFGSYDEKITRESSANISEFVGTNQRLYSWLRQKDIMVYSIRVFRSVPKEHYHLHRDLMPDSKAQANQRYINQQGNYDYDRVIKLNFIYNSWGSTMTWYSSDQTPTTWINPSGVASEHYQIEDCREEYTTACDQHCLVNGGQIHTLKNTDNKGKPRICYSLMIQNSTDTLTWDQAVDIFNPWLRE